MLCMYEQAILLLAIGVSQCQWKSICQRVLLSILLKRWAISPACPWSSFPTTETISPILLAGTSRSGLLRISFRDIRIFLKRNKPFDPRGRYETEDQAKEVDRFVYDYLCKYSGFKPIEISGPDEYRDAEILSYLGDMNFKEPPSL